MSKLTDKIKAMKAVAELDTKEVKGKLKASPAKFVVTLAMVGLALFSFAACNKTKGETQQQKGQEQQQEDPSPVIEDEAKLMAQDLIEIANVINGKYEKVYKYVGIGNEYYVYGKKNGNVTLNKFALSNVNVSTHAGLQNVISQLKSKSAEEIADFAEGAEYQIGDYIYGNPAKGETPFTKAAGITSADAVSTIELSKVDDDMYAGKCVVVEGSQTTVIEFESEINGVMSNADIINGLLKTTPAVTTIAIGMDTSVISAKAARSTSTQKTEEELMAEDMETIETMIAEKYDEVLAYDLIGNDYYVYSQADDVITLNKISLDNVKTDTHADLQDVIEQLDSASSQKVVAFDNDGELPIGGYVYGNPAKGTTPFTEAVGVTGTGIVSAYDFSKDGNTYTLICAIPGSTSTKIATFTATITGDKTDKEIMETLATATPTTTTINLGVDTTLINATEATIAPTEDELDFSGLETALETVITSKSKYYSVNDILSYAIKDGKLRVVFDYSISSNNGVAIYEADVNTTFDTQEKIDNYVDNFDKNDFTGVLSIVKASSDITTGGKTYSKSGIDGDNLLARAAGVENAIYTWFSEPSSPSLSTMSTTHYRGRVSMMCLYEENNELKAKYYDFSSECQSYDSKAEIFSKIINKEDIIEEYNNNEVTINMGENLMAEAEASAQK